MEVARPPPGDRHEAFELKLFIAVGLPMPPGFRVPVESQNKRADRVIDVIPRSVLWPLMAGKANPSHILRVELGLGISRLGIGLLAGMPW